MQAAAAQNGHIHPPPSAKPPAPPPLGMMIAMPPQGLVHGYHPMAMMGRGLVPMAPMHPGLVPISMAGHPGAIPAPPQAPAPAAPPKPGEKPVETEHDRCYNMNPIMCRSITNCIYYKNLFDLRSFEAIFEKCREEVFDLEPVTRNKTPAPAFCMLFKFFTMKLSENQLDELLTSEEGVLRGLGFLYVRFLIPPKKLWYWFKNCFADPTPIPIGNNGETTEPARDFIKRILKEQKYQGYALPKIPIPVHRQYRKKILLMELLSDGNRKYERYLKKGNVVKAQYAEDTEFYDAEIEEIDDDTGIYTVNFTDYDERQDVCLGQIKIPKDLKREFRANRRSRSRSRSSDRRKKRRRSRSRSRSRDRRRSRSRSRGRRRRSRDRSFSRSPSRSPDLDKLIMEEDRRSQSAASAKHCAQKVMGYKKMLSVTLIDGGSTPNHMGIKPNDSSRGPVMSSADLRKVRAKRREKSEREKRDREKTVQVKAPSREHLMKMQKLREKYQSKDLRDK